MLNTTRGTEKPPGTIPVTRFEHVIFGVIGDNFQHFLLVHMLLQTRKLHNRRPWALLLNKWRTLGTDFGTFEYKNAKFYVAMWKKASEMFLKW